MQTVSPNDTVLLLDEKGKKWMLRAVSGRKLSTHRGETKLDDVIGTEYGGSVVTSTGESVWVLRPTCEDFMMKGHRPTQIVYPKDAGIMLTRSGVRPGSQVVEGGTGSGALTSLLAWFVRPQGHVFSYDKRSDFIEMAKRNLERAGLLDYVTLRQADITSDVEETGVDVFFLDLGAPWRGVEMAHNSLVGGGVLSVVTPTFNQAERTVDVMGEGFVDIRTVEISLRDILVRPGRTRPGSRMIGHTAFLTTGRKTIRH